MLSQYYAKLYGRGLEKMMKIVDFTKEYIIQAQELAKKNYEEERRLVSILPQIDCLPSLDDFAENGLGVVALEDDKLIGFLCCYTPWENAFTTTARGTFSPIHAHGAIKQNREKIYQCLYQAAAKKWVQAGISSHSIGLYAHDKEAIQAFFTYGFGLRCVDAIRPMEEIQLTSILGYDFLELKKENTSEIMSLRQNLSEHMAKSPCFMKYLKRDSLTDIEEAQSRIFAAKAQGKVIAFLEVTDTAENFATEASDMQNICGAFCMPQYRGKGVSAHLLNYMIMVLKKEGHLRLGVDFESFNPTANGFWPKYFKAYTNGVVRRIDENVLRN